MPKKSGSGITSFALHLIAMALMLCDHLWGTFPGNLPWLGYCGRIAFPLFAFMLTEGFLHTADRKKYALRLLIFALISEIPFDLMLERSIFYPFHQNVLWTFLIAIGMLSLLETAKAKSAFFLRLLLSALVITGGYLLGFLCFVDYFGYGVLTVALFYFTHTDSSMTSKQKITLRLLQAAGLYWINCEMMKGMMIPVSVFGLQTEIYKQSFALLALPLIWLYRGKQGLYNKTVRAVYYWFYPVHLLLLGGLITLL